MPQTNPVDDELVPGLGQIKAAWVRLGRHKVAHIEDGAGAPPRGGRVHHVSLSGCKACRERRTGAAIGAVGPVGGAVGVLGAGATIVATSVGGPVRRAARLAAAAACCRKNLVVGDVDRIAGKEMIEEHDPNLVGGYGLIVDDSALARIELRLHRRERHHR